jgi:(2Fe-2S) ferredoxin
MIKLVAPYTEFSLVGIVNQFVVSKKGRVKSFELKTEQGNYNLKIPSYVHKKINYEIHPQIEVEVKGKAEICLKTAKIKLKVEKLSKISPSPTIILPTDTKTPLIIPTETKIAKPTSKILICQKSTCWKQGGEEIYHKLQQELQEQGLDSCVMIKKTGCMGNCKKAPNLVVLPDKTRYQNFNDEKVCQLIDTHFLNP